MDSSISHERRNLVSACVPSHFKRALHITVYVVTHIILSVRWRKLNKALEINEALSTHRITKQYQTTVHFHLIMYKQCACWCIRPTIWYCVLWTQNCLVHTATTQSSHLPHRILRMIPEELKFSLLLHFCHVWWNLFSENYVASKDVTETHQVSYLPNARSTGFKIQKLRVNWQHHVFACRQV